MSSWQNKSIRYQTSSAIHCESFVIYGKWSHNSNIMVSLLVLRFSLLLNLNTSRAIHGNCPMVAVRPPIIRSLLLSPQIPSTCFGQFECVRKSPRLRSTNKIQIKQPIIFSFNIVWVSILTFLKEVSYIRDFFRLLYLAEPIDFLISMRYEDLFCQKVISFQ